MRLIDANRVSIILINTVLFSQQLIIPLIKLSLNALVNTKLKGSIALAFLLLFLFFFVFSGGGVVVGDPLPMSSLSKSKLHPRMGLHAATTKLFQIDNGGIGGS